jgi:hypothetical protein
VREPRLVLPGVFFNVQVRTLLLGSRIVRVDISFPYDFNVQGDRINGWDTISYVSGGKTASTCRRIEHSVV